MLSLPPSARIYICHQAVDMRKSFDGLAAAPRDLPPRTTACVNSSCRPPPRTSSWVKRCNKSSRSSARAHC